MATARALVKNAFLSSQKGRLVADEIRGLPVGKALDVLDFSRKKGACCSKKHSIRLSPTLRKPKAPT